MLIDPTIVAAGQGQRVRDEVAGAAAPAAARPRSPIGFGEVVAEGEQRKRGGRAMVGPDRPRGRAPAGDTALSSADP